MGDRKSSGIVLGVGALDHGHLFHDDPVQSAMNTAALDMQPDMSLSTCSRGCYCNDIVTECRRCSSHLVAVLIISSMSISSYPLFYN